MIQLFDMYAVDEFLGFAVGNTRLAFDNAFIKRQTNMLVIWDTLSLEDVELNMSDVLLE